MLEYRITHKSLRDFRPLRYSNRDGDAEGEHVNRGRDTPIFCATLQVLDMSTLGDAADVKFGNFGRSKTQNASLFRVHAMFRHDCPLTVKLASAQWNLANKQTNKKKKKKLGEILHLLICSFLLCLSWLFCS